MSTNALTELSQKIPRINPNGDARLKRTYPFIRALKYNNEYRN